MIREGGPGDLPRLRAIQTAALAEPSPELLETAADGPLPLYVVEAPLVVGYAVVVGGREGTAYLPELAVHPDHQGRGHGSRLLGFLGDRLPEAGYASLHVVVRADEERARGFYAGHGFESRDRLAGHFEGRDGLVLARPLDG